jgi:transposase InsO family protein
MHLTLKKEATKPAAKNLLQQQAKFDHFIDYYNRERPHQYRASIWLGGSRQSRWQEGSRGIRIML